VAETGFEKLSEEGERIATGIVNGAYRVHQALGPELLESVYKRCVRHELEKAGFEVLWEQPIPIRYDGIEFDEGFKLDLWVNRLVVVEAKSVVEMNPVFRARIMSHRRLMNLRLGFLINFNVPLIKDGIKRMIL